MTLRDARALAQTLMLEHNLSSWSFRFDRAKRRFGMCDYTHQVISLSRHLTLLNETEKVREVILHEIAHALTPDAGHGPAWRKKCRELGIPPARCFSSDEVAQPAAPYALVCPRCGLKVARHRKTNTKYLCRTCWSKRDRGLPAEAFMLEWRTRSDER